MRKKTKASSDREGCIGALAILVLCALVVGIVYVIASGGLFGPAPKNALVPDVASLTIEEAQKRCDERGLRLRRGDDLFSEDVAIGLIVSQDPVANRLVKEGHTVTVFLSKGPNAYSVPNLIGMSLADAQARLRETNLGLGRIEKILNATIPEGQVVSQNPEAGKKMPFATKVDLKISVKKANVLTPMPDLTGNALTNAEGVLVAKNLLLSKVKYRPHPGTAFGQVVSQDPPAGMEVPLGTKVTLEVAIDNETARALVRILNVRCVVPVGREKQQVKIVVSDRLGENEVYNQVHRIGEIIETQVKVEGQAFIKTYFDGQLVREDDIPLLP
ncbi:MAG: PASTA domain-containing protein [bacterium]|jgi:serine/threonine-protein kinase